MFRSDQQQVQKIDAGKYDRNSLTILKVPLLLPYGSDWQDFERAEGFIEVDGVPYTYVEKKISRDTLYLACLPNEGKAKLKKTAVNFTKASSANAENNPKEPTFAKKGIFGFEYNDPSANDCFVAAHVAIAVTFSAPEPTIPSGYHAAPFSPPDVV